MGICFKGSLKGQHNEYSRETKPDHFLKFIFNWRIIALQYCIGFFYASTLICLRYTYAPPSWTPLPPPTPCHPSRLLHTPSLSSLFHTANSHWLSILHMVVYVSMPLSPFIHLSFLSHSMSVSLFSISVSPLLPCKKVHHTIFLDSIYMH